LIESTTLPLRRDHRGRFLQPEFQQRFARHFYFFSARKNLHSCTRRGACSGSNRSATSAARNRADDRSKHRPAAYFLRGVAAAPLPFQTVVTACERVIAAINHDARQLQL